MEHTVALNAVPERLLMILKERSVWMDRAALSNSFGRILVTSDWAQLHGLEPLGLIEIKTDPAYPVKVKYMYRAK